jgi:hypothetical protein
MELATTLAIGNYFAQFILILVLSGTLIVQYIKKTSTQPKAILCFIAITILVIINEILNAIVTFNQNTNNAITIAITITTITWIAIFISCSIKARKYIDKTLLVVIIITSIIVVILTQTLSASNQATYIITVISDLISITCGYLFVIKFLIKTSKK